MKVKLDSRFDFKIASSDRVLVVAAAQSRDQSPSDFARTVLLNVARATLATTDSLSRDAAGRSE